MKWRSMIMIALLSGSYCLASAQVASQNPKFQNAEIKKKIEARFGAKNTASSSARTTYASRRSIVDKSPTEVLEDASRRNGHVGAGDRPRSFYSAIPAGRRTAPSGKVKLASSRSGAEILADARARRGGDRH